MVWYCMIFVVGYGKEIIAASAIVEEGYIVTIEPGDIATRLRLYGAIVMYIVSGAVGILTQ